MTGIPLKEFKIHSLVIAANDTRNLNVTGTYLACLAASGAFKLSVDDSPETDFFAGLKVNVDGQMTKVIVRDTSGASNTVQLIVGYGDFEDARLILSTAIEIKGGDTHPTTADESVAATSTEQVLAANLNRREAWVTNLIGNAREIRVGDSSTGAARGVQVPVGATIVIPATAAIHVHNPHSAAQTVALMEVVN
jgi:hypothetical protein